MFTIYFYTKFHVSSPKGLSVFTIKPKKLKTKIKLQMVGMSLLYALQKSLLDTNDTPVNDSEVQWKFWGSRLRRWRTRFKSTNCRN